MFGAFDDGLHVGDAGEDGRDEAGGVDAGLVELAHGLQTAFNAHAAVHLATEFIVEGVDAPTDAGAGECLYQVEVAQHEVALGGDADAYAAALKLFQQGAGALVFGLAGLVAVGHRAEKSLLADIALGVLDVGPQLHVNEVAPRLGVVGETFHERGVAVLAGVGASYIRIDREVADRQVRLGHHTLDVDFFDCHKIVSLYERFFD